MIEAEMIQEETVIPGCIEIVEQGIELLEKIDNDTYTFIAKPYIDSPIGSHMRHIIDLFLAVFQFDTSVINYNLRRRGHTVETCRQTALNELKQLRQDITELSTSELKRQIIICTENSISSSTSLNLNSSVERELSFASLHATHHYAIIKAILNFSGTKLDCQNFGYAPATTTFLKEQA